MSSLGLTFALPAPLPPRPWQDVYGPAMARGARCDLCSLRGCGQGPVMGELRRNAALTIVAEAPGENELLARRPLVGWPGQILEGDLNAGGLTREHCSLTNTMLCRAGSHDGNYVAYVKDTLTTWKRACRAAVAAGQPEPPAPVLPHIACAPRLSRDVADSNSKVILAMGKFALEGLARELGCAQGAAKPKPGQAYVAGIAKQHGAPVLLPDGRVLMSSFHPAMAAPGRGRSEYLPVIRENLMRAAWVARHDGHIPWQAPVPLLEPTLFQIERYVERCLSRGAEVTADIETNSLDIFNCLVRCVGLGADLPDEEIIVVPFRNMDGTDWWPTVGEKVRAANALRRVFDELPLVFHNGLYDTAVLIERGLMTNLDKTWVDTLQLHRGTFDNDLPHDLGFVARRYFCFRMWKSEIDHKVVSNVGNRVLWHYNGIDVGATKRVKPRLVQSVVQAQTVRQVHTDHALLPVMRDAGRLGLVIDEKERGKNSAIVNWQAQRALLQLREMVGLPHFNPRSVPQVQELLFDKWKYQPVLGLDGYEIKEALETHAGGLWQGGILAEGDYEEAELTSKQTETGEMEYGSTSSGALVELMKRREQKQPRDEATGRPGHWDALKMLLEFRAWDKLRGTYLDNLKTRAVDWKSFGHEVGEVERVCVLQWSDKKDDYVEVEVLAPRSAYSLFHTSFKLGPPTGRWASSPNVQNIPAGGKLNMRTMFVAPPGHTLVGADSEQAEGRIYAADAGDALILDALAQNPPKDLHSMNAATFLARNLSEVDDWYKRVQFGEKKYRKYWRTVAKRLFFLIIYGGEKTKLYSVMSQLRDKNTGELEFPELTPEDVETWYDNLHNLHPEIRRWHAKCFADFDRTGYAEVPAIDFRKRWFIGGPAKKNAVPNMRIQGLMAGSVNRAALIMNDRVRFREWSPFSGMSNQVHDYLQYQVPHAYAPQVGKWLEAAMLYEFKGVKLFAKACLTHRWSEQD